MSREQQKRGALAVLRKYAHDPELLADSGTEPAVLPDDDIG
jgi:hypothetical protein